MWSTVKHCYSVSDNTVLNVDKDPACTIMPLCELQPKDLVHITGSASLI